MRKLILGALVAVAGLAVSIGVVFGSGSSNTLIRDAASRSAGDVSFHPVSGDRSGKVSASALARRGFKYRETAPFTLQPDGQDDDSRGGTGRCPRRWKAISGYFGSNSEQVVPTDSFVEATSERITPRLWTVIVHNEGGTEANAFVGIVCGRV